MDAAKSSQSRTLRLRVAAQMAGYQKRLAERVRYEREKMALSRDELALRTGLSAKTIERIEEQKVANPQGGTIRTLADTFKLDAEELRPPDEIEEDQLQRLEEKVDELQEAMDDLLEVASRLLAGEGDVADAQPSGRATAPRRAKRRANSRNG